MKKESFSNWTVNWFFNSGGNPLGAFGSGLTLFSGGDLEEALQTGIGSFFNSSHGQGLALNALIS